MVKLKIKTLDFDWNYIENIINYRHDYGNVNKEEICENIRNSLKNNDGFKKEFLIERNGIELYVILPNKFNIKKFSAKNYFLKFAYSLIFGFVHVVEGNKEYRFFGNPAMLLELMEEFHTYNNFDGDTTQANCFILGYIFHYLIDSGIVKYFQDFFNIQIGYNCKSCKTLFNESSYSSMIESNPQYDINDDFIYCPMCANPIWLSAEVKEIMNSFKIYNLQKYFFNKDIYSENFKLQYFSHLHHNNSDSEFLEKTKYELLNNQTYFDLFGTSKEEFLKVWNLFSCSIMCEMKFYWNFKYKVHYSDDGYRIEDFEPSYKEHYYYMIKNADRLIRKKKLENLLNDNYNI
jgi:hypothetical protein